MTQCEEFSKILEELGVEKDFDECLEMVEYLMYKIIDTNQLYRGVDRSLAKYIENKEMRSQIYCDAVQEKIKGDEYTLKEWEFIKKLSFMNKE